MAKSHREEPDAFIPDPEKTHKRVSDDLAEFMGESFVSSVTTGDDFIPDGQDEVLGAEIGGPFLETDARTQYGSTMSLDDDLPDENALPEAFPTAVRSGVPPVAPRAISAKR